MEQGLLAECHQQIALIPMAERAETRVLAFIGQSLDSGYVTLQRDGFSDRRAAAFGVIAFNEGLDDEPLSHALAERLALQVNLIEINLRDLTPSTLSVSDIERARGSWRSVALTAEHIERLALTSLMLGVGSARALQFAVNTTKILAALQYSSHSEDTHIAQAIALTLGHRATQIPAAEDSEPPAPETPEPGQEASQDTPQQKSDVPPEDHIQEAAKAAIPVDLLRKLASQQRRRAKQRTVGKSGAEQLCLKRGRPCGTIAGDPRRGGKLQLIATLRAAAPWQALRRQESIHANPSLIIRKQDLRLTRYRHRSESTTVFVVDASGSSAMHRLSETKGAVELLLADCYSRRDSVALISFRGEAAELILPPTRSLLRAKRALAGLPGGGGTPLAHAIDTASLLAEQIQRSGSTPAVVLLTDGVANINLSGLPGREQATIDALASASRFRTLSFNAVLVDTSPRGQSRARELAQTLSSQYVRLPHASAQSLFETVRAHV
jgi:magnesium chelatase subunit D